jgi:hypothetical protein
LSQGTARSLEVFRQVRMQYPDADAKILPERIAEFFDLGWLQNAIADALQAIRKRIVFLYDGLDEGWVPTQVATGVLGGLAKAAAEFRESSQGLRCMLFIRDNMLRALAQFDGDYTRNIENSTLRLQWNEEALLRLVTRSRISGFGIVSRSVGLRVDRVSGDVCS